MSKSFYSIALYRTSLFIQAVGLLPFLSGTAHALNEGKWVNKPSHTQEFDPIAFEGASGEEISVTESSQYLAVVNDQEQPVLLRSPGAGQVPFTEVDEFLNTFFPYPVTHNTYRVGSTDYRVTTVGGSGYRTFNFMRTRQGMKDRHAFFLENASSNESATLIPPIGLSRELVDAANQNRPDDSSNIFYRLLEEPRISLMFTNEQGELTPQSSQFVNRFYNPQNRNFRGQEPNQSEAESLSPDFTTRARILAENIIANRSNVLNIFRTTAEELGPILDTLNRSENVTATLISASQHGMFRPSMEAINLHAQRTDDQGNTRQNMITDAFIFIRYSDWTDSDRPETPQPAPTPVDVTQFNVGASEGYAGNLHLPAAIQFQGNEGAPGFLLVSLLSGRPGAEFRLQVLDNIRRILDAHRDTPAILTSYTYKSGSQEEEKNKLLSMRTKSSVLTKNSMPSFYLGGDDSYSASNPAIKALLEILLERSGYANSDADFSEARPRDKDDDDHDNNPSPYTLGVGILPAPLSASGAF